MIPRAKHQHGPLPGNPGAAERGESASANREHQLMDYLDGRVCVPHKPTQHREITFIMFFFCSRAPRKYSPIEKVKMVAPPRHFRPAEGHQSAAPLNSAKGTFQAQIVFTFDITFRFTL